MKLNDQEIKEFLGIIDRSLAYFGGRPTEPGPDLALYENLLLIRETMIRAHRDQRDPNVNRGTPLPPAP